MNNNNNNFHDDRITEEEWEEIEKLRYSKEFFYEPINNETSFKIRKIATRKVKLNQIIPDISNK